MKALPQFREQSKCDLASEVLRGHGTLRLRATGMSMLPTLWPGDLLTIQHKNFDQVAPGDLVLYSREGRFFVHRVRETAGQAEDAWVLARGDAMPQDDPPLRPHELLGRVTAIQRGRSLRQPARRLSPLGRILAWVLCYFSSIRSFALRLHALRHRPDTELDGARPEACSS